jgi:hypothetical protein
MYYYCIVISWTVSLSLCLQYAHACLFHAYELFKIIKCKIKKSFEAVCGKLIEYGYELWNVTCTEVCQTVYEWNGSNQRFRRDFKEQFSRRLTSLA